MEAVMNKVFLLLMQCLMPLRKMGLFGTPDKPRIIKKGKNIPWWLEMRYPFNMDMKAGTDLETFYCSETGWQMIYPINTIAHGSSDCIIKVDGVCETMTIIGAPTSMYEASRKEQY